MQAAQGHELVVAASHLILRLLQPSHALITICGQHFDVAELYPAQAAMPNLLDACACYARPQRRNLHHMVSFFRYVGRRIDG